MNPGTTISHYRVVGQLGRGGMGVVYKAEDTKLDRTVALKLLPPHALVTEDDRARFYREARAAAALNHPNIAHVYEIDEAPLSSDGGVPTPGGTSSGVAGGLVESRPFIAMEYIDGESLADLVAKGPLPLKDAISYASQIAEGLKVAHEAHVVHRDIKSGNIMLTKKGVVKILDFGLAKTAASTKLTQMGSTLGTVAYMSPEQAKGEEVDRRSDIFSLGVILYEMITGRLPFKGDYEQAVVYGILNEDPESLTTLRAGVPMALDGIIAKMLAKDPDLRYQHVDELPADLKAIDLGASNVTSRISTGSGSTMKIPAPTAAAAGESSEVGRRKVIIPILVAIALLLGLLGGFLLRGSPPEVERPVRRYVAVDPVRVEGLENPLSLTYAYISPDGRRVAFNADGKLWIRSLDNLRSVAIPGTEGAGGGHEWTRDSRAIGYADGGSYRRVLLSNNEVTAIGDTPPASGWWEFRQDGSIAYLSRNQIFGPVATGVQPGPLTREIPGLATDRGFADLPDNRGFAVVRTDSQAVEYISIVTEDGSIHDVVTLPGDSQAKDLFFTSSRYLLFTVEDASRRRAEVWAVQLDLDRFERMGEPRMVVQNARDPSASDDGTLLYLQAGTVDSVDVIVLDRNLRELRKESTALVGATAPEFSPDGKYISIAVFGTISSDIWVLDRMLGGYFQLSFEVEAPWRPTWSPDSRMLAYHSRVAEEGRAGDIYVQSIDDGSAPVRLVGGAGNDWGPTWSPDGEWIVYVHRADSGGVDSVFRVRADGSGDPEPVVKERFPAQFPGVSPDGRFVTYHSNRAGQWDVYVSTYPDGDRHFRVTNGGAAYPKWKGDYIYYYDFASDAIMGTRVITSPSFRTDQPVTVATSAQLGITIASGSSYNWDISADGREIVIVRDRRSGETPQAIAVENWRATVDF